jgi:hypothetical protein
VSSPASVVAQEIQDLTTTVEKIADAIRAQESVINVNVPDQLAPIVNVTVPDQQAPQITVNVPEQSAPVVNVAPAAVSIRPVVNVAPNLPNSYEVVITERDSNGYISKFVINPL